MKLVDPLPVWPRRRRVKQRVTAALPSGVRVTGVTLLDGTGAVWAFDAPVTAVGEGAVPELRILSPDGWVSAISLAQWDDTAVVCDFPTNLLAVGQAWEITQLPEGLDFADATLLLPQSGETMVNEAMTRKTRRTKRPARRVGRRKA